MELPEETPLPRSDVSPVLVAVAVEAFSDVEVTPVPLEVVAVATEEAVAGVASSSCCVLTPSAVAISLRVSPDTTVYVPAVALVMESACLGFRRIEVYLQTGFASAGNGPEIKEAPTART
jgi:hypothetical protein